MGVGSREYFCSSIRMLYSVHGNMLLTGSCGDIVKDSWTYSNGQGKMTMWRCARLNLFPSVEGQSCF